MIILYIWEQAEKVLAGIKGYIKNLKEADIVLKDNKIKHPYIVNIKRILKTIKQMLKSK